MRKGLETWSASHAATQATESDIDSLTKIIKAMEERIFSCKSDADFHLVLSLASHNTIQAHLMSTIYDLLSEYLLFLDEKTLSNQEIRSKLYHQHLRIFNAIKERNSEAAQREVMEHLTFVEGELKKLLFHD